MHRTIAIVGSGVLADPWAPVIAAMQEHGYPEVGTANAANFALARIVYIGRQLESYAPHVQKWTEYRESFREKMGALKGAIAEHLTRTQRERTLETRPDFGKILTAVAFDGADAAAVVTTNWDTVVEQAVAKIQNGVTVRYIHGSIRGAGAIYLPSEIAEEPYRTEAEKTELVAIRRDLVKAISQATRVVIYGLSVSPLDAELGQLLASGMHKSAVQEVHIVDPEFRGVGERVATLRNDETARIPIFGRTPSNLDELVPLGLTGPG